MLRQFVLLFSVSFLINVTVSGQNAIQEPAWIKLMYQENAEIADVLNAFEAYYQIHPFEKNQHTQFLKRWIKDVSYDPTGIQYGNLSEAEKIQAANDEQKYLQLSEAIRNSSSRSPSSSWTPMGPFDWDHEAAERSYAAGMAHIYTVEQCKAVPNILYAGTATAGIWKSTDYGMNWVSLTDDLNINQVYAIEVNHVNPNSVYARISGNVRQTFDGGLTWNKTGDSTLHNKTFQTRDIRMHPTDTNEVWLVSDNGLYRTKDGGKTYSTMLSGSFFEIEYHPTNPNIIYVVKLVGNQTTFYKSIDGGNSFTLKSSGWPNPGSNDEQKRTEIAVSKADSSRVYALCTGEVNGGTGLYGIYVSHDEGETWTFNCCGPQPGGEPDKETTPPNLNLMGWEKDGDDDGGQFYYDLALAVSPTNADTVIVCGVNMWISGDGGNTFVCPSKWSESGKKDYVHADIHDVHYNENGEIWVACDGGIFFSDDNMKNFERRVYGISGTEFWGYDAGYWEGEVMLGGVYHNGIHLRNGNLYNNDWLCTDGGDGVRAFVNPGNEKKVYSDFNKKILVDDRQVGFYKLPFDKKPNGHLVWQFGRTGKMAFFNKCYNHYLVGPGTELWKTEDDGATYTLLHDFEEDVADVEISPLNDSLIYVVTWPGSQAAKRVYRSRDGGASWVDITPDVSFFGLDRWIGYDVEVSASDESVIWLARVPWTPDNYNGAKVYKSTTYGDEWINITTPDLDGEQLTNIVHHRGSNGGIYLGTRRAVYYKNDSMTNWQLFNNGLPVSIVSRKQVINYRTGKIRQASNRGVWECDLYETNSKPIAMISADRLISDCDKDTIQFVDRSVVTEDNVSWQWSFPGASWVSDANARTPKVRYTANGSYDVGLIVADIHGSDTQWISNFITVAHNCNVDTVPGYALECAESGDYAQTDLFAIETNTLTITAWIKPDTGIQENYTGIVINDGNTAGFNFRSGNNMLGYHWPGGRWQWESGLIVPPGKWSYVAMVATPDSMTVYVNGQKSVHNDDLNKALLTTLKIGSYKGWGNRNYKGLIDEVCIWNRSLSETEIREMRHLTKNRLVNPLDAKFDPTLIAYYQFNETSGAVQDKTGLRKAYLKNEAKRITSTAPVGGGQSQLISLSNKVLYNFDEPGVEVFFGSNYPKADVVVTRLNISPDQDPHPKNIREGYWIINQYDSLESFDVNSLLFNDISGISVGEAASADRYKLYHRSDNAEGDSWSNIVASATSATSGNAGSILFEDNKSYSHLGQLVITNEGDPVLPNTIVLTANLINRNLVALSFEVAEEYGIHEYRLQRSVNGRQWENLHSFFPEDTSSRINVKHSFEDNIVLEGMIFYQVLAIRQNESRFYSNQDDVFVESTELYFTVSPNPIDDETMMYIHTNFDEKYEFSVYDMQGKEVFREKMSGIVAFDLRKRSAGIYSYLIRTTDKLFTGRLIKN